MSLYPCRMGGGSGDTGTEVTLTLPTSGSTQAKLLGNANTIYLMSNLFNATTFFTTYINGVMKTNEISTIYGTGENWGVSVGRLTGDFKKRRYRNARTSKWISTSCKRNNGCIHESRIRRKICYSIRVIWVGGVMALAPIK